MVLREGREDNFNRASDDLSKYKVVRKGDLVLNKMKTWQGSLGVSHFDGIVSPAYFVGRRVGEVDDRYAHHLLRSAPLITEYGARSKGIRPSQWDLPWDEFASIKVRLPALGLQRAIADYLDTETARIDALVERKARLLALAQARFQAMQGRIYVDLAAAQTVRLGAVARIFSGTAFPPSSQGTSSGDIPFFKVSDFSLSGNDIWLRACTNWISHEERLSLGGRVANPGSVLFPKVGAALLGNARRITTVASMFDNNVMAVTPKAHASEFMHFVLSQIDLGALANPGPVPSINEDTVASLRVPLSSVADQERVVRDLRRITAWTSKLTDKLTAQLILLREHRQALITAAVTGELEIPGAA